METYCLDQRLESLWTHSDRPYSKVGLFRCQYDQMREKTTEEGKTELLSCGKTKCQNIGLCLCRRAVCHCQAGVQRLCVPIAKFSCMTIYMTYNAQIIAPSAWITLKAVLGFLTVSTVSEGPWGLRFSGPYDSLIKHKPWDTMSYSDFTASKSSPQHYKSGLLLL